MDYILIIGFLGAGLILLAFVLNNFKVLARDDLSYDFINAIGGWSMVLYAILIGSIPFAILNIVWALVGTIDVIKTLAGIEKNR
ncbi:hypothetical protein COB87_001745 [Candidatus Wolfebacteria bacterium]|nr:hypothetical protein [Candidatus Wolfebacteria bacterium]